MHVEDPVHPRHDLERPDRLLPLLECPRRQTGGVRERPSGDAVLDADRVPLGHRPILSPGAVERLVDEAVRQLVVLAPDGGEVARYEGCRTRCLMRRAGEGLPSSGPPFYFTAVTTSSSTRVAVRPSAVVTVLHTV